MNLSVNVDENHSPSSSVFDLPTGTTQQHVNVIARPQTTANSEIAPGNEGYKSFVVISGGTGGNNICSAFGSDTCYVLPVSDDGGSSSEIIRVLGGPSVGDIRSRLVRLIPHPPPSSPLDRIRNLLSHRLPADGPEREARDQWRDIVEGRSPLWSGIPNDRKETIRGFLVYFESELLKRAHKNFTFVNGSIGNYLLAAAQQFFRSLPSSIFLLQSITNSQANILPVVVTNHTVTIAAELDNGERLVGQCEISHPVLPSTPNPSIEIHDEQNNPDWDGIPDGSFQQRPSNVKFAASDKGHYDRLAARISRLFYINAYGMEIHPSPNPDYLAALGSRDVVVYSCGSLWTSIMPCLALRGVASAIAKSQTLRAKILLLNSKNDRETDGYTAKDYVMAIVRTLNAQYRSSDFGGLVHGQSNTTYPVSAFITDLVYLEGTAVSVDDKEITALGVKCTKIKPSSSTVEDAPLFGAEDVKHAMDKILQGLDY